MSLNDLGNVKGPRGATGATGATGPQGPTGATGPQGPPGPGMITRTATANFTDTTMANGCLATLKTITAPSVSGYHPVCAFGTTDKWEIGLSVAAISGTSIGCHIFSTYDHGSGASLSYTATLTVMYLPN